MYIIEIKPLGADRRWFVTGYSNTKAAPEKSSVRGDAKVFSSFVDAERWAGACLKAYYHQIVSVDGSAVE